MCFGDDAVGRLSCTEVSLVLVLETSPLLTFSSEDDLTSAGSTIVASDAPWSEPDDPLNGTKVVLLKLPGEEGALIAEHYRIKI